MEVITVVGRWHNINELSSEISNLLYDGFRVVSWHTLGQPGIDEKERFLILIEAEDETEYDFETQAARLESSERGVRIFDSRSEALEYAEKNYDLAADKIKEYEHYNNLVEEFPPLTADEKESFDVLDAFMKLGRVAAMPAKLNDERAIAIVMLTKGADEYRITPLAVLASEDVMEGLELPGGDEDE